MRHWLIRDVGSRYNLLLDVADLISTNLNNTKIREIIGSQSGTHPPSLNRVKNSPFFRLLLLVWLPWFGAPQVGSLLIRLLFFWGILAFRPSLWFGPCAGFLMLSMMRLLFDDKVMCILDDEGA